MRGVSRLLSRLSRPLAPVPILGKRQCVWTRARYELLPDRTHAGAFSGRRFKTTEAGDNKSGHIEAGPNEGIFFLSSIFARLYPYIAYAHADRNQISSLSS